MGRFNCLLWMLLICVLLSPSFCTAQVIASGDSTKVHIYVRAFLPREHSGNPGYIIRIPNKPNMFVIPSPIKDGCFLTDNRLFSNGPDESSRVTTEFMLVTSEGSVQVQEAQGRERFRTGWSHKVDCKTGDDLVPQKKASTSNMSIGAPARADGIVQVVIDGRANNPFVSGSPDINYGGTFTFNTAKQTLRFQGSTGVFPAYEAYAQVNDGPIITLFQNIPRKGTTAIDLIDLGTGFKQVPVDVTVELGQGLIGKWQSNDPAGRFRLEIDQARVVWIERNGPSELRRTVAGIVDAGGLKLSRQNDEEVLMFIGFQTSLRNEILSRGPRPSYLLLTRDGKNLRGLWFGLIAIKDEKARLKQLKQPGESPGAPFEFLPIQ